MNAAPRPFAAVAQAVLVLWLLASIVLIGQQVSMRLYQIGLISLAVSSLSQIAFGNIPATADFRRSLRMYAGFMAVVALIFALSIVLAPYLVAMGR